MLTSIRSILAVIATLALTTAIPSCESAESLTVEQVVMLMRHGVRPPLKEPPVPPAIAPDTWPTWQVPSGWLTAHGAEAIGLLGEADSAWLSEQGVLPESGCPKPGAVLMISDSAERTIATGDAYLAALLPNCGIENQHQAEGVADPLFAEYSHAGLSADIAQHAVDEALGPDGISGAERRIQSALDRVTRIVCGDRTGDCGPRTDPSAVTVEPALAKRCVRSTNSPNSYVRKSPTCWTVGMVCGLT